MFSPAATSDRISGAVRRCAMTTNDDIGPRDGAADDDAMTTR
jgi:hypothetical protein